MRLLVHAAGEADLLLSGQGTGTLDERATRVRQRRERVDSLVDRDPPALSALGDLLVRGGWADGLPSTSPPVPLLSALRAACDAGEDTVDVIILGTQQPQAHPLDSFDLAQTLARAVTAGVAAEIGGPTRIGHVGALRVEGQHEAAVIKSLTEYLNTAPTYQQALLTWGSGATSLSLGVVAALAPDGLPWRLVTTTDPTAVQIVDPLASLEVDPTIGVLVRWRMFDALADPEMPLTSEQRALVEIAVHRRRDGFQYGRPADLLTIVADASVRRDGTSSLAVRQYVVGEYERLLAFENAIQPDDLRHQNLLEYVDSGTGRATLGRRIGRVKKRLDAGDPVIRASVGLTSFQWLMSAQVHALRKIGNGSHRLEIPGREDLTIAADFLSNLDVDQPGWKRAGLPVPPVVPPDTVVAVWVTGVGRRDEQPRSRIGEQLATALPQEIVNYLGLETEDMNGDMSPVQIAALVFGTEDVGADRGSLPWAWEDERHLVDRRHQALVATIHREGGNDDEVEAAISGLVTARTGALLLVPTGPKPAVRTVLQAMRRVGAHQGLPLFVRQMADPRPGEEAYVTLYRWPALTGGDVPLLVAARQALNDLELDVAWRLLDASAAKPELIAATSDVAMAFAARWHQSPDGAPSADVTGTRDMAAQRIALVQDVLAGATTPADRIRLLVLAANVVELSIAAEEPSRSNGRLYRNFRSDLAKKASQRNDEGAAARVLLLLNAARDKMPITHGNGLDDSDDPDEVVRQQAEELASGWKLTSVEANALPRDVDALVSAAVRAAISCCGGDPSHTGDLREARRDLMAKVDQLIRARRDGDRRR